MNRAGETSTDIRSSLQPGICLVVINFYSWIDGDDKNKHEEESFNLVANISRGNVFNKFLQPPVGYTNTLSMINSGSQEAFTTELSQILVTNLVTLLLTIYNTTHLQAVQIFRGVQQDGLSYCKSLHIWLQKNNQRLSKNKKDTRK
jgi:hypothetical protein